jgi:cytosine/adenosine deaminase-related metal-dependent hydrolase
MQQDWNLKQYLLKEIRAKGGFVNAHSHLDKAYLIKPADLALTYASLQEKWDLIDELKRSQSVDDVYDRMAFGIEQQMAQGVTVLCSFIDVDPMIEDKAILAAQRVRERYGKEIKLLFANQTIKGVLEPQAREWFDRGAEFVDIIGGLPGKDRGREAEHMDVLLSTAKKRDQMVHVHVDQLNDPNENETELLVDKTIEHGMQGKVVGVHGISIAAHPKIYRQQLYKRMAEAAVMMIACPSAWIDHQRREDLVPSHNAVTPVDEMAPAGITVAIGPDDIADYYKPFSDGDMWTELRFLLEACHYYDLEQLTNIATVNGRKVLGLS